MATASARHTMPRLSCCVVTSSVKALRGAVKTILFPALGLPRVVVFPLSLPRAGLPRA